MKTTSLTGPLFVSLVRSGAANLSRNKKVVNSLNVFPVPDGDTGDNMSMTINSAVLDASLDEPMSLFLASNKISEAMLLGARGNSGVILSRIFKGLSKGFENKIEANALDVVCAFESAVAEAYSAVTKPVEGTILTVLKDGVQYMKSNLSEASTLNDLIKNLNIELKNSLDRTPDLLPSLKEAGVVDSGGVGLAYIFEGFELALNDTPVSFKKSDLKESTVEKETTSEDISLFTSDSVLKYGYCTEFLLRLQTSKIDLDEFSLDEYISYLNSVGDSVVAFRDDSIVKVHVHSKTPGDILSYSQKFGEFLKVKIENMTLQHSGATIDSSIKLKTLKPKKKYSTVAVASGEGIIESFKSIGVDYVIEGGQTMNPSTKDFIDAFNSLDSEVIFVYPNNKNILMSATQAADGYEKSRIVIIPTRTIGEGYLAISMLDTSSDDVEKIIKGEEEVISTVVSGIVSKASRSLTKDSLEIHEGDYIGFVGDDILVDDKSRESTLLTLSGKLESKNYDLIILIYGKDVSVSEAEKLANIIQESAPLSEVTLLSGGQPVHDYLLILN